MCGVKDYICGRRIYLFFKETEQSKFEMGISIFFKKNRNAIWIGEKLGSKLIPRGQVQYNQSLHPETLHVAEAVD